MIRLYDSLPSANGYKIRLLLAQLGIPYEQVLVDIFSGESRTESFYQRKNPDGRVPVLEPEPNRFLAESNAILLFLAEGTPLLPADRFERAQVHQWLFFEQNAIEPNLGTARFWQLTGRKRLNPEAHKLLVKRGQDALASMERHLASGHEFLVGGRYTVADIALYGFVHVAPDSGATLESCPHLRAWLERVKAQPGHIGALPPYPPHAHLKPQ